MANTTIYANSDDGMIATGGPVTGTSWAAVRNAGAGTAIGTNNTNTTNLIFHLVISGRGPTFYDMSRLFFRFDLSSFPSFSSIDSAELYVFRHSDPGSAESIIAVRHDQPSFSIDYPEYVFYPSHDPASGDSMTAYSSTNTESTGSHNTFTLNATALTEIEACANGSGNGGGDANSFQIALVHNGDYTNTAPTARNITSFRMTDYGSTASDPHLKVTYTAAAADNATFFGSNF